MRDLREYLLAMVLAGATWVALWAVGGPEQLLNLIGKYLWSPTNDSVLNFLIDAAIVMCGVVLVAWIVMSGIAVVMMLLALLAVVGAGYGLVALGSMSPTGAVLAAAIAGGIAWLLVRAMWPKTRAGQARTGGQVVWDAEVVTGPSDSRPHNTGPGDGNEGEKAVEVPVQSGVQKCPDCRNGTCRKCNGTGKASALFDQCADATNPFGRGHVECSNCAAAVGVCPTCKGSGIVGG